MSSTIEGEFRSKVAGEDLSDSKYFFVTLESDNTIDLADAIDDFAYGVLQDIPEDGQEGAVKVYGQTKVVAKEALAINDFVGPATDGKAQVAVATQYPRGIVVKAAGAEDDYAEIELFQTADEIGGSDVVATLTIAEGGGIVTGTVTGATFGGAANQLIGFWGLTPVNQPVHNADPASTAAMTAVDPDAVTAVAVGDLVAVQNTGFGATAEADFDKIGTNIDALVADVLTIRTQLVAAIADIAALDTGVDANNAAINAINANDAETGLTAAA